MPPPPAKDIYNVGLGLNAVADRSRGQGMTGVTPPPNLSWSWKPMQSVRDRDRSPPLECWWRHTGNVQGGACVNFSAGGWRHAGNVQGGGACERGWWRHAGNVRGGGGEVIACECLHPPPSGNPVSAPVLKCRPKCRIKCRPENRNRKAEQDSQGSPPMSLWRNPDWGAHTSKLSTHQCIKSSHARLTGYHPTKFVFRTKCRKMKEWHYSLHRLVLEKAAAIN